MKWAGALLLSAMLLASPSRSAVGQSSPAGPAATSARAIRVIVNGREIALAAPPIAHSGQVMVPTPGLLEAFGASAVWLPDDRSILISNRTKTVLRLRINDPYAVLSGQPRLLPIAPVLLRDVPFIPAQAIFGLLGAWTRFDDDARVLVVASIVHGVTVQKTGAGAVRLAVNASGPVQAETSHLKNPERLVIDLRNAVFRHPDQDSMVGEGGIARVRVSQFQTQPYVTRIVLDLQQAVELRVADNPTSFDLAIEARPRPVGRPPAASGPAPAAVPPAPPAGAPSPATPAPAGQPPREPGSAPPGPRESLKIMQVRVEQASGVTRVLVDGTAAMQYAVRELIEPDRLVVDVMDSVFIPVKQEIPVNSAAVENVRAAQFQVDPDISRVVVTLKRKIGYTITAQDGGGVLVITVSDAPLRGHAVAIDPGHGGKDSGAIGPTGLMEKHVTLDIGTRVRRLLVEDGVRVIMTRESDAFIELPDRPRLARERGATVFVSIHANASARAAVNSTGSETYYNSPQSLALAQMIQDELGRLLGIPNRGIKTANFLVLRDSANVMPAVLVEVAFLSHPQEEARLRDETFRDRIALSVARGIMRFLAIYPVPAGL